jgi:C-terminal processing protease CtpA/Prc
MRCRLSIPMIAVAGFVPASARAQMPDSVRAYLSEALDTLAHVSLHRDEVDWPALRDSVMRRASRATTYAESWPTIEWALRRVDRHSFLQTPAPPTPAPSTTTRAARPRPPAVSARMIDGRYGYLLVPWFPGAPRASYVDSLQRFIGEMDGAGACGWVVDLRGNEGGNMWPMLAGVGPLLGDTLVGSFEVHGDVQTWRYVSGGARYAGPRDSMPAVRGDAPAVRVRDPLAPVAVLTDRRTASSGEATLVAFRGRPNVRAFGDTTAGYNSVNSGYRLRDGANMVVTIGRNRDRTGHDYPLRVAPDEVVSESASGDAPLARATAWLAEQGACRR